jgi:hypothetical protein
MTTNGLMIVAALGDPEGQGRVKDVVVQPYEKARVVMYESRPMCVAYDEIVGCWGGGCPAGFRPKNVVVCVQAWDGREHREMERIARWLQGIPACDGRCVVIISPPPVHPGETGTHIPMDVFHDLLNASHTVLRVASSETFLDVTRQAMVELARTV